MDKGSKRVGRVSISLGLWGCLCLFVNIFLATQVTYAASPLQCINLGLWDVPSSASCVNVTFDLGAGTSSGSLNPGHDPYKWVCTKGGVINSECYTGTTDFFVNDKWNISGLPSAIAPAGKEFDKWVDSRGATVTEDWLVEVDSTFYAKYKDSSPIEAPDPEGGPGQVCITYDANGGEFRWNDTPADPNANQVASSRTACHDKPDGSGSTLGSLYGKVGNDFGNPTTTHIGEDRIVDYFNGWYTSADTVEKISESTKITPEGSVVTATKWTITVYAGYTDGRTDDNKYQQCEDQFFLGGLVCKAAEFITNMVDALINELLLPMLQWRILIE